MTHGRPASLSIPAIESQVLLSRLEELAEQRGYERATEELTSKFVGYQKRKRTQADTDYHTLKEQYDQLMYVAMMAIDHLGGTLYMDPGTETKPTTLTHTIEGPDHLPDGGWGWRLVPCHTGEDNLREETQ